MRALTLEGDQNRQAGCLILLLRARPGESQIGTRITLPAGCCDLARAEVQITELSIAFRAAKISLRPPGTKGQTYLDRATGAHVNRR